MPTPLALSGIPLNFASSTMVSAWPAPRRHKRYSTHPLTLSVRHADPAFQLGISNDDVVDVFIEQLGG